MARNRALRSTISIVALWVGMRGGYLLLLRQVPPTPEKSVAASFIVRAKTVFSKTASPVLASRPNFTGSVGKFSARKPSVEKTRTLALYFNPNRIRLSPNLATEPTGDAANPVKAVLIQPQETFNPSVTELPQHQPIDRFSVSSWLLLRGVGGSNSLASNGQLGGSQMGARFVRALGGRENTTNFGLTVRVTSPLGGVLGKEAALGFSAKQSKIVPFEVIVERRFGLDHSGRNAFALTAVAGISEKPLGAEWRLSAYGQVGVVGAKSRDKFADAAVTIERPIGSSAARLGGGLWAAAQPGVSRLDIGPRFAHQIHLGRKSITVAAEWRQRIAGKADPGSGAVLVLGGDF